MLRYFDRARVTDALDSMGLDPGTALWESYSGKGMYGDQCFGVNLAGKPQVFEFIAALGYAAGSTEMGDPADVTDLATTATTDGMGRDLVILYFPGWQLATVEELDAA